MSGGSSAARIHQLLEQVSKLPVLNRRAIGAVVGACVADAAARPLHWLYDQEKLETYIEDRKPEFWPLSLSPYYSLQTGENSCYFDLLFVMLDSLPSSSSSSVRTLDHFKANIIKFFGPGTPYNEAYDLRPSIYDPSKRTEERQPVPGPWIQKSVVVALSSLLQNEEPSGNPESKETDGTVSSIPLIAQLAIAGTDFSTLEVQQSIKTAASVLSSNNVAILHTLSVAMTLSLIIKHGESALEQQALLAAVRGVQSELLNDVDEDMVASELMEVFNASSSESHTTHVAKWYQLLL